MAIGDSRNYPALFLALDEVLETLGSEAPMEEVLRHSIEASAEGFGAQKMLLLVVEDAEPWRLRAKAARGLTPEQVAACEDGHSVPGVSASCIRDALVSGRPVLVQDAEHLPKPRRTGALRGQPYSVLCAPICDPQTGLALAVVYFQNTGIADAFDLLDRAWIEVYARALGRLVARAGQSWAASESDS